MKKTITVMTLLAGAISVYSQGAIEMSDYYGGLPGTFDIQVFGPQSLETSTVLISYGGYSGHEEMGNTAMANMDTANGPIVNGDFANSYWATFGTTVYAAGTALGLGYDVQILAGPVGTPLANLAAQGTPISFWYSAPGGDPTTSLAGTWATGWQAITGVPTGVSAEVAIEVWYAGQSGQYTTLAAAQAAGTQWGISSEGETAPLGGMPTITHEFTYLPSTITDFSLVATPEPNTYALGLIGASTLLFLRRK